MAKKFNFEKKIKEFQKFERTVPKRVGNIALNHFLESWDNEAFSDGSKGSDPWAKRKRLTKQDKTTGKRRGILIGQGTGILKGSMRLRPGATFKKIAVGSYGIEYASRHNRGLSGMPKRQFVGKSKILDRKIRTLISKEIKKIL